jgi:hypothetical protein
MSNTEFLKDFFYQKQAGLSSQQSFYLAVREVRPDIKRTEIIEFYKAQPSRQIHSKPRESVFFPIIGPPGSYQMDLMFYDQYKQQNNGYNTLLTIIEINSRMGYVYPLKNKTMKSIIEKLMEFIGSTPKIIAITSDKGSEFNNTEVKQLLKKYDIKFKLVETNDKRSMGKVERFNRTIRTIIERYFTTFNTVKWIDILPKIVSTYNNTIHRSIGMKPVDVTKEDISRIHKSTIEQWKEARVRLFEFEVGDKVRILQKASTFGKGGSKFSKTIHIVEEIIGNKIKLEGRTKLEHPNELMHVDRLDEDDNVRDQPTESKAEPSRESIDRQNQINRRLRKEGLDLGLIIE